MLQSYPGTDLTGTASDNQFTLQIPASAIISSQLLSRESADHYLVAEIDFSDGTSLAVRFQGGAFETTDTDTNTLWVYGGTSLDQELPETRPFTDIVTIAPSGGGINVQGSITDSDGDTDIQMNQTFAACTTAYVFVYDNENTITGSAPGTVPPRRWR